MPIVNFQTKIDATLATLTGKPAENQWIEWTTVGGDKHRGYIVEVEEGTAKVLCEDGVVRAVEVD